MTQLIWVCLGSALGGGARYLTSGWIQRAFGASFPYGTLAVNLAGSFLIGALMYVGTTATSMSPTVRLALTTGVMGGFTTYSAFSYETMAYLQEGAWGVAVGHILLMVVGGLTACLFGWWGSRWLWGGV